MSQSLRPAAVFVARNLPVSSFTIGGVIKDDALQSQSWWAPRVVPPRNAPNVLLMDRPQLSSEDLKKLQDEMQKKAMQD
jgi:hypothetical protein